MLDWLIEVVNPTGAIGVVGVYLAPDPGAKDDQRKQGIFPFPLAEIFDKAIAVGTGQCPVKRYNAYLRDLIIAGQGEAELHRQPPGGARRGARGVPSLRPAARWIHQGDPQAGERSERARMTSWVGAA